MITEREYEELEQTVTRLQRKLDAAEAAIDAYYDWLDYKVSAADFIAFESGYRMLEKMYESRVKKAEDELGEAERRLRYAIEDCAPNYGLDPAFGSWEDCNSQFI